MKKLSNHYKFITSVLMFGTLLGLSTSLWAENFDIVIKGGRVIDPETGLDAIRNVGISGRVISSISTKELAGKVRLDASGLVVSPGFFDLHAHGQNIFGQTYQVRDGVTTALELEGGSYPIAEHLNQRNGSSLINYGYSSGHEDARTVVKNNDLKKVYHEKASPKELSDILEKVEQGLDEGGIGIGLLLDYLSRGVDENELEGLFRLAARRKVPLLAHCRTYYHMKN